jgi:hypothetical protein
MDPRVYSRRVRGPALVRRVARLLLLDRLNVSPSVIGLLQLPITRLLAGRRSVRRLALPVWGK